jgi:hypothetical protein
MKFLRAVLGAFGGAGSGYVVGVVVGMCIECSTFFRADPSNLCGLIALFWYGPITALIGLIAGVMIGLWLPKSKTPDP